MNNTVKTLKVLVDYLDGLSEQDIKALMNKNAKLKVEYNNKNSISNRTMNEKVVRETDVIFIGKRLEIINSKDEGEYYLRELKITKSELIALANEYKISTSPRDTSEKLISKIVDGIIKEAK